MLRGAFALLVACSLGLGACGGREDNEARLFLDRVSLIHHDAPAAERRRHLGLLEQLSLSDAQLVEIRETCIRGHRALLEAEDEQAGAARELGRLTGGRNDVAIPRDKALEIEAAITRSSDAVEAARGDLSRCQTEISALELRYSGRR